MATNNNPTAIKNVRERSYLARDFDSLRAALLSYARQYYPDQILNFSEASLGGLLLDLAAYVGDNMSFYLDHLYNELNYETAVEPQNIETAIRNAGVDIVGAAPATVNVQIMIEIPVDENGNYDTALLPTVYAGSVFSSDNGIKFNLLEDLHFWKKVDNNGTITIEKADNVVEDMSNGRIIGGKIVSKYLSIEGRCTSGEINTEDFSIGSFTPFRQLTLTYPDVNEIVSVYDSYGNTYYKVENLANDVVYINALNVSNDANLVPNSMKVIPVPYRYTAQTSLTTRKTTLTFGGGNADSLEDDIIPDPSEFAIPFATGVSYTRTAINPKNMLKTSTLGIATSNTSLSITYRHGGGLSHNVSAQSIRNVRKLDLKFPSNPDRALQLQIRNTLEVRNPMPATGGENAPTIAEFLDIIPTTKNSQERIVTKEDLLARVYMMPSNLGRVFRASVSNNQNNPLSTKLTIISRDANQNLIQSPQTLKTNLKKYLNQYRMISDAIEIFDAEIINYKLSFKIIIDPIMNKNAIAQQIKADLIRQLDIKNFHIGQPIVKDDIHNSIFTKKGIISVSEIELTNLFGTVNRVKYSSKMFTMKAINGLYIPPEGCIFELKNPEDNINITIG